MPDGGRVPRMPVLSYHHVHDGEDSFFRAMPQTLRAQLELLLAEGYVPISTEQLIGLKGAPSPSTPTVVVTFDDGYEDFLLHAWPILEALAIPATLFVVADHIGGWNDWDSIRWARHRHLDLDQLTALRAEGVTIGSHSCSHRLLAYLDDAALDSELGESQRVLQERLGAPVRTFAYPGGHVDPRVRVATARYYDLGFATTTDSSQATSDPYLIPRFDPCFYGDLDKFRRELQARSGIAGGEPQA
jgi:peptidoglycan/xylan/chitin deacetylase (PgdA/CDA1 family)